MIYRPDKLRSPEVAKRKIVDHSDNRNPPSHSERVQARQRANTPWPKLDRSWVDHPFYTQADESDDAKGAPDAS